MGVYTNLMCDDCRQYVHLGKAYRSDDHVVFIHLGVLNPPNWKQELLNQVLWKFLADHCGHRIAARLDDDMTDEMFTYQQIGGDDEGDITIEQYLSGWVGLNPEK